MRKDYQQIVGALMREMGLKQAQFAERIGASQPSVSRWAKGVHPDPHWSAKLDEIYENLLGSADGFDPQMTTKVRVMGRIGAGAEIYPEFEQIPPEGLFSVELEVIVDDDALAFLVEGDSMFPRFNDGDVVICGRPIMSAMDVVGQEAAVRTSDGRRFLKRVRSGSKPGLYDLESHNSPIIRDVKLEWAAGIDFIVPGSKWRSLDRAAQKKIVEKTRKAKPR